MEMVSLYWFVLVAGLQNKADTPGLPQIRLLPPRFVVTFLFNSQDSPPPPDHFFKMFGYAKLQLSITFTLKVKKLLVGLF